MSSLSAAHQDAVYFGSIPVLLQGRVLNAEPAGTDDSASTSSLFHPWCCSNDGTLRRKASGGGGADDDGHGRVLPVVWSDPPKDVRLSCGLESSSISSGPLQVVLPCLPVSDVDSVTHDERSGMVASSVSCNLLLATVPWLKVDPAQRDAMQRAGCTCLDGFASGVRSALVPMPPRTETDTVKHDRPRVWLRLKGCGNNSDGLVLRKAASSAQTPDRHHDVTGEAVTDQSVSIAMELRGTSFEHCSTNELAMTAAVERACEGTGLVSANEPVGWFRFQHPAPESRVIPTCTVMRTLGDRRLGTHVLAGLTRLLPHIVSTARPRSVDGGSDVDAASSTRAADDPLFCWPAARPVEAPSSTAADGDGREIQSQQLPVSVGTLVNDLYLALQFTGSTDAGGLEYAETALTRAQLLDLSTSPNDIQRPVPRHYEAALPAVDAVGSLDVDHAASPVVDVNALWRTAVDDFAVAVYRPQPGIMNIASILGALYRRLGVEAGLFLGCLHRAGISWGTYADSQCFPGQLHCNAHANNFVLLDPRSRRQDRIAGESSHASCSPIGSASEAMIAGYPPLLGYLDFDMGFHLRDLAPWVSRGSGGAPVRVPENVFEEERLGLLATLCGGDVSTGVEGISVRELEGHPYDVRVLHEALLDTLVLGFEDGYGCRGGSAPADADGRLPPDDVDHAGVQAHAALVEVHDAILRLAVILRLNNTA